MINVMKSYHKNLKQCLCTTNTYSITNFYIIVIFKTNKYFDFCKRFNLSVNYFRRFNIFTILINAMCIYPSYTQMHKNYDYIYMVYIIRLHNI